jgi:hypothetical protein
MRNKLRYFEIIDAELFCKRCDVGFVNRKRIVIGNGHATIFCQKCGAGLHCGYSHQTIHYNDIIAELPPDEKSNH